MDNPFGKITSLEEVLQYFHNGSSIMFGGFGGVGSPPTIIDGILKKGVKDLVLIGNDTGFPHIGIGKIVSHGRARKVIASHIGSNPVAGKLMEEGKLEVEFSPQGTLAERIRAGGAGIAGILTDVGIHNEIVAAKKPHFTINGRDYLVESALTAEIAVVYSKKADPFGNLVFDKSARNTNPLGAMAGELTIAEAEEIVPLGALNPDEIMTPGIFVNCVLLSEGVNWKWAWE